MQPRRLRPVIASALLAVVGVTASACGAAERTVTAPAPRVDPRSNAAVETAVFAGGCFWGVEGVLSHIRGVRSVESGYAGPTTARVNYESVGTGSTGFAEAVRVRFDPRVVSYGTLLRVMFSVVTDPTTLNRQGPDDGTQYRSAVFPLTSTQAGTARAYLVQLDKSGVWKAPVVTRIEKLGSFQPAERYHQDFLARNPRHPYITAWDMPKLAAFKTRYPTLWSDRAAP